MGNLPLHPVVVHFPIALAALMPLIVIVLFTGRATGRMPVRAWWAGTAFAAALAVASVVALRTGEAEEDRVEDVVPESAIETHEERAELLMWSSVAFLAIMVAVPLLSGPRGRIGGVVAVVGSGILAAMAVGVGHSGGELVYRHNAGSAYTDGAAPAAGEHEDDEHEEDDDRRGRR